MTDFLKPSADGFKPLNVAEIAPVSPFRTCLRPFPMAWLHLLVGSAEHAMGFKEDPMGWSDRCRDLLSRSCHSR